MLQETLLSDSLCKQKSHCIITINGKMKVWKCKLIFPSDTLQQKIEIIDLKPFLAGENTSVLIILATTVLKIQRFHYCTIDPSTGVSSLVVTTTICIRTYKMILFNHCFIEPYCHICNIHKLNEMIYTDNKNEMIKSYCINFIYLGLTQHHLIGYHTNPHRSTQTNSHSYLNN